MAQCRLYLNIGTMIAYCYIIVPNKSQTLCCRVKKASVFQALKLEIYLKYAFNLNMCYYNFVWTPTCSTVCACMARQQSWNFYLKTGPFFVSSTCENHPFTWLCCLVKQMPRSIRHVNATKSYLHFDRFAGEAILCSNFFCFLLFLDVLFLS